MPQAEGGYVSLANTGPNTLNSVYQTTTEPSTGSKSVFDSVKRVIGQAIGQGDQDDALLIGGQKSQPSIVSGRDRDKFGKTLNTRMPSAPIHTPEQARLLGTMPVDPMDDIELRSVQLQFPNSRGSLDGSCDQRRVVTDKGDISVAVQGDTSKPAILTYHDLGLNYSTSFAGFFNYPSMRALLENFCVYHVTAPGQEDGAPTLPEDYIYPTIDELSTQLMFVLSHFGLKSVIGFGVGAGANILARFALNNPDKVGALCLINCISTPSGWIEWGYQSFNARYLRTKGMTQGVVDYLMWHHFGRNPEERNHDLSQLYKSHFERSVNPTNLAMLINSYINRTDLQIARTPSGSPQVAATLKMPVINVTGSLSPHVDDTVTLNGRLNPENSSWMKISDCAMVMEEQPGKLAEAFRLFLQGEGYVAAMTASTVPSRSSSMAFPSASILANARANSCSTGNGLGVRETERVNSCISSDPNGNHNETSNNASHNTGTNEDNNSMVVAADTITTTTTTTNNSSNNSSISITNNTSGLNNNNNTSNGGAQHQQRPSSIRITENPIPEAASVC